MAQKVTVALEDDLTGGPAGETVRFGFEGSDYEIDLNAKNAAAFGKQLGPYLEHARRAGRAPGRRAGRTAARRQRSGDIRAWVALSAGRHTAIWAGEHGPAQARARTGFACAIGSEDARLLAPGLSFACFGSVLGWRLTEYRFTTDGGGLW